GCGCCLIIRCIENDQPVVSSQAPVLLLDLDAMLLGVRFEVGGSLARILDVLDTTLGELEKGQVSTHRSILLRCGTKFTPVVAILRRLELTERRADRVTERTRRWTDQSANGLPSRGRAGNVPSLRPTARATTTAIPAPIMRFMSLPSKGK